MKIVKLFSNYLRTKLLCQKSIYPDPMRSFSNQKSVEILLSNQTQESDEIFAEESAGILLSNLVNPTQEFAKNPDLSLTNCYLLSQITLREFLIPNNFA